MAPRNEWPPLSRIVLTQGVVDSLFEQFDEHRKTERGNEEIGWLLLGHRRQGEDFVTIQATLPAGTNRDAGVAHVQFSSTAQAVAARFLRASDPELIPLGVAHTHPGSLTRPSSGDYKGDREWIQQLRGRAGVFAIGTISATKNSTTTFAISPAPSVQCRGSLCFHWYGLHAGAQDYVTLPVEIQSGTDLASPWHGAWEHLETFAEGLEQLQLQLRQVQARVTHVNGEAVLLVSIPIAARDGGMIYLQLKNREAQLFVKLEDEMFAVEGEISNLPEKIYELLAIFAAAHVPFSS